MVMCIYVLKIVFPIYARISLKHKFSIYLFTQNNLPPSDMKKDRMFSFKKKNTLQCAQKRQWGTERDMRPLSIVHEKPTNFKIALARLAIVSTVVFWLMYASSVVIRQLIEGPKNYHFTVEIFGYLIVVSFLTLSALVYLIAREGALQRFSKHLRTPRATLDKFFFCNKTKITVLVPSYSEEPGVIRKTLLSAALQEYPNIRIVLLIDDNPNSSNEIQIKRIKETKSLGKNIEKILSEPLKSSLLAFDSFKQNNKTLNLVSVETTKKTAMQYKFAAKWLNTFADKELMNDHVDVFFADQVLRALAKDLSLVSKALAKSIKEKTKLPYERVSQLHQRLISIFSCQIDFFERKNYISLSHEPNKAMNLNSYIGLMGGRYKEEQSAGGLALVPTIRPTKNSVFFPDSEFLLTLDADSVLLRDYCLRLVYFLQQPSNSRVAVTQTPYSSFRGSPSRIERLSGATTDIQHLLHQGMSKYGAAFWVGANAVIRKRALEDVAEMEQLNGYTVKRYIQDSTVIEDTESSIDLAVHGWELVNYPERLSYSATPPDFGSLVVQRRRWANGGLLIMPKLFTHNNFKKRLMENVSAVQTLIRLNYMASIAWSSFGLLFLLVYPYDGRLLSPLVVLAALPYFLAMGSDLKYCRYKAIDVLNIYGFNLILLPVNLAGVLKSMQQALTSKKIPFARTPKVKNRTVTELPYVVAPLFIIGFSLFTVWRNVIGHNWGNALFAAFNASTAIWATISYIGIGSLITDIWLGVTSWLYVDAPRSSQDNEFKTTPSFDWKSTLYYGEEVV